MVFTGIRSRHQFRNDLFLGKQKFGRRLPAGFLAREIWRHNAKERDGRPVLFVNFLENQGLDREHYARTVAFPAGCAEEPDTVNARDRARTVGVFFFDARDSSSLMGTVLKR